MASARNKLREKTVPAQKVEPPPQGPDRFYNRELSWLQFNRRVLEEAQNERHPLLERLRFLSISASNLDEFYMVRVAGIYGQVSAGVQTLSQDGLTPAQQLRAINRFAAGLVADKQACWRELKTKLGTAGIHILEPEDLQPAERSWLQRLFMTHIFPILTPIAVDPAKIKAVMDMFKQGFSAPEEERIKLGKDMWKTVIEETHVIATVGLSPAAQGTRIVKNTMGNVPTRMYNSPDGKTPAISRTPTYYFKA